MVTLRFNNVFVQARATVGGPKEGESQIGHDFDYIHSDLYGGEQSFEKSERKMITQMLDLLLAKTKLSKQDINLTVGGDLSNQIASSNYALSNQPTSFLGIYAACATSALAVGIGAMMVENNLAGNVISFVSSHYGVSERQYRYFLEYGIQRKPTYTYTVTGAGGLLLNNKNSPIKVTSMTIGNVINFNHQDANDLGMAMAPAALATIKEHLKNLNIGADYYDLIVTGDLSYYGMIALKELASQEGVNLGNIQDCGNIIFPPKDPNTYAGGSGAACSALVVFGHLLKQMEKKALKKVLLVATGALLSPIVVQQKDGVAVIAHAISFEVQ